MAAALSKDRLRLWLRLLKVSRQIEGEIRERLRENHGTTLPRFDVMAALDRHPEGLRMSALSEALRVSNGNVTGIVERLVKDGLVERAQSDGDRRAFTVRLTGRGREVFTRLAVTHEGWIDALLAGAGSEDVTALMALLARLDTHPEETT